MYLLPLFLTSIYFYLVTHSSAELVIKSVQMRNLRPKDIGLIFDVSVYNDPSKKQELLDFRIRSEQCCLKLPANKTLCDVAQLLGGNFGEIASGSKKVVSILWPTITLYNRVGHCDITLSSYNKNAGKIKIAHTIYFDTTINKQLISDTVKSFVSSFNYTECPTLDLNPLSNCTPVDCEEKYFGQMSFFNTKLNLCEEVPDCTSASMDMIYDYTINECVDLRQILCKEHLEQLQKGLYDNNVWEPKHNIELYANFTHTPLENYDSGPNKTKADDTAPVEPLHGILQGFFMILAALAIYLCISCCTFFLMVLLTKRSFSQFSTSSVK